MITIEALIGVTIELPGGERHQLHQGQRLALSADVAQKLLAKGAGKVRRVQGLGPAVRKPLIETGTVIRFRSPLFGVVKAKVLDDRGAGIWVFHPATERESFIPNDWVLDEEEGRHAAEHP